MNPLTIGLIIFGLVLFVIAGVAVAVAWRREGKVLAMRDAPTLSTAELLDRHRTGMTGFSQLGEAVEVVGTIECEHPLAAPFSETICVAYRYRVNESTDQRLPTPDGGSQRDFAFSGLDDYERHVPRFYVRDASGRIAIDPKGATFDLIEKVARYEAYTGLAGSERQIWREEYVLPLGNRVYVLGYLLSDQDEAIIGRHPLEKDRHFLISHRDEDSLSSKVRTQAYMLYGGALLALGGAIAAWIAAALLW
ncbi:GIDE domain-containing protein [Candidatus Viridilinea mediisalina]|uniref:RING-type E3 ubiquitin transferase n=1 Tax=Candidatus Viridilinea mediisalina TaxID=2024553 RepID=A0A2A6RPF3_9CHLR|nr:GIDE domain-containing protein [Candidatus Viridilinea mediisalina]PDW04781.1 hypothetical protein CJ255_01690 [Candidatus Viridilinea mediisalina]